MLYDAHKYPYKYLPTANLTPLVVTALFSIFMDLIATLVITDSFYSLAIAKDVNNKKFGARVRAILKEEQGHRTLYKAGEE